MFCSFDSFLDKFRRPDHRNHVGRCCYAFLADSLVVKAGIEHSWLLSPVPDTCFFLGEILIEIHNDEFVTTFPNLR